MKPDRKLWAAIFLLIGLIIILIVISVNRNNELNRALRELEHIKQSSFVPKVIDGKNGHTPILGVDYTVSNGKDAPIYPPPKDGINGLNGLSIMGSPGLNAYELAVENGFQGTQQQWLDSLKVTGAKGDPGDTLQISCQKGYQVTKSSSDSFWQPTLVGDKHVKCELSDD